MFIVFHTNFNKVFGSGLISKLL